MARPVLSATHAASCPASDRLSAPPNFIPPNQNPQFKNYDEAMQALATRPMLYNYYPSQKDHTIPRNQMTRNDCIRQLYDSFVDTSSCIDCENTTAFINRWQGIVNNTSQYMAKDIETCCHKILEIAINLHTTGPRSLMVFDDGKLEQVYKYRNLTFAQRIDSLCELLRLSKARCQALMRFDGLEMAVATAPLMAKQSTMNSALNRKRQGAISKARALRDKEETEECDDGKSKGDE